MKNNIFLLIFFVISVITFTNCNDAKEGSKEHIEAVEMSEQIEEIYEKSKEQVAEMKDKRNELLKKLEAQDNSSSGETKNVLSLNQSIAKGEGIVENLKTMISQHQNYIEKHEETALGVADIIAQHQQIKDDFSEAQKEMKTLNGLYNNLKMEYEKRMNSQ